MQRACSEVIKELKEHGIKLDTSSTMIKTLCFDLVGRDPSKFREVFGDDPGITELWVGIIREIGRGNIRMEDGKICRDGCVDSKRLGKSFEEYYTALEEIRKRFEELEECKL
jgi:hypothetical protein